MSRIRNGIYIGIPMLLMTAIVIIVFIPFDRNPAQDQMVQISTVELGKVVRSFSGEGIVEPQSEVLILSPASSIIKEILEEVGSHVNEGEPIIILDPSPVQSQIENIQDQLEMKQNSLRKNKLNARSTKVDLDYNVQVKNLRIASLKSELADQEQLLEVGGISPARFEKTKQELELAEKDLVMLKEKNSINLQQLEADEEGLRLQIEMQEKELAVKEEALSKMIIRAPSAGIILSIRGKVGEKVDNDRLLIEMSDLTNFKIQGKVDDDYSEQLKTGTRVYVGLDNEQLTGVVGTVNPVIRDRKIEFDVNLRESNHYKLRPNLNVSLDIVREERDSVLRINNGPAIGRGNEHKVFVLQNGNAIEREITTGMRTEEYVEVIEGLTEGERIVLSDISSVEDLEELELEE
ncbi:MAG: HlyD family efflux transporter periplasmic adaptor subunit [Bacteroidales bacterium]|nr:HlyD family efflux transporter periplasmic adaptor subunit [Bacteroidales bacterium]